MMRVLEVMMFVAGLVAAILLAAALSVALAGDRCESRPAVGGGVLTSCREPGRSAAPQQYVTRPAVGGGTVTTGGGRTCTTRKAVGGGEVTACR
jgi:hypothetical protein